jgi:multiple sugar transport system permease protein
LIQARSGTPPAQPRWLGRRERWFYLLAAPWILGLVALQLLPALAAAGLAFASWEPPLAPTIVGLDNFAALAGDARFGRALANTAVYGLGTVIPGLAIGLALAMLLAGVRRGGSILRAAVFLPAVVSGVATALMWAWIFNPRFGLLDAILGLFGLEGPAWLRDAAWAMPAMILMGLWNVGVNVVIYTAALATVPRELTEAAALDGAGRAARFRHVTWPVLTPVTFYLVIVNAIAAFQVFTPTYLLTGGGPDDATLTTALYTYQTAFDAGRLGYASAMTIGVFAIVVLLTAVQFRFLGRRVTYLGAEA